MLNLIKKMQYKKIPYQSSEAIPKSLQHLIKALLFAPSEAVANPEGSK